MKHLRAGEAPPADVLDKPQTIEVGKTYGHLEVLGEVEKSKGHDRRWRCKCLNVPDKASGKMCGQITIKKTGDLTKSTKFRACKGCIEIYMRGVRQAWNGGGFF